MYFKIVSLYLFEEDTILKLREDGKECATVLGDFLINSDHPK